MIFLNFIQLINILYFLDCKIIILPFNKITIENFLQNKTINDFINYNIYTNISIGTPPQIVGHFIDQDDYWYYFKKPLISHNKTKLNQIMKNYENLKDFWFIEKNSSSLYINNEEGLFSDVYYFRTLNDSIIKMDNFESNIFAQDKDKYKCGVIGLKYSSGWSIESTIYIDFFNELKKHDLINEFIFTIIYEEKNKNFLLNDRENFGKIIIGEFPYIYDKEKFIKGDEIVNNGRDFSLLINEIKFNYNNDFFSEENIEIKISFKTAFIKGSGLYRKEINIIFFSELIKNGLCSLEIIKENIFENEYLIYSCTNNDKFKESIKSFPSLNFEIKTNNLTFIFTYKDLFQLYNNRFYFMIIFRDERYSKYDLSWTLGEIFLRKYLTVFNFDAQTISFFRNQVDEVNKKSKITYTNKKQSINRNNLIRTFIEIIMGLFIIVILFLLYRKYRNSRKLHANELEDSNYVYDTKENKHPYLLTK